MTDATPVIAKTAELLGLDPAAIDLDAPLFSLAPSSFRVVELVIELQEEFGVSFRQEDMNAVDSVGDLVGLVVARLEERAGG